MNVLFLDFDGLLHHIAGYQIKQGLAIKAPDEYFHEHAGFDKNPQISLRYKFCSQPDGCACLGMIKRHQKSLQNYTKKLLAQLSTSA